MPHPAYSYLSPTVLEMALQLARELRRAAGDVATLFNGGSGGRVADKAIAVEDWVGPHHDTFVRLFDNESASARTTELRLRHEADDWARFWATATNARNDRLYDEAMDRYDVAMGAYRDALADYREAIEEEPGSVTVLSAPRPPTAPVPPPFVPTPTAADDYSPTR